VANRGVQADWLNGRISAGLGDADILGFSRVVEDLCIPRNQYPLQVPGGCHDHSVSRVSVKKWELGSIDRDRWLERKHDEAAGVYGVGMGYVG